TTVGAALHGRVLIVDDVITAGTAVREVMELMLQAGAKPAGILVALDRQERGTGTLSAIQEIEEQYHIPILRIITLAQIIDYLEANDDPQLASNVSAIKDYRAQYGV